MIAFSNTIHPTPGVSNPNGVPTRPSERRSSSPFLSGDTFRSFCNHIFDETNVIFRPEEVKKADIIFVRNDVLPLFFSSYHPRIKNPYILITHNNIFNVPGKFIDYLEDEKIIAWFGHNVDRNHQKLHAIPLGLANYHWPHGKFEHVLGLQKKAQHFRTGIKTYINFRLHTNSKERTPIWNHFKNQSFSLVKINRPHRQYLQDMTDCSFVVSPPGAGLDCHRNWEALYLNCIPIIQHSSLDTLFEDLPVVLVDDWQQITEEFLSNEIEKIKNKKYNLSKLYAQYWFDLIHSVRDDYLRN